jgi:predicted transcriptional regulator
MEILNTDKASVFTMTLNLIMLGQLANRHLRRQRMPSIGSRELCLLEVLWQNESQSLSALDVLNRLPTATHSGAHCISINTVQSTLERLVKKQLLKRAKYGRAYYYHAIVLKQELIGALISDIAKDMTQGNMDLMMSGFMDFVSHEDPDLSVKLSRALQNVEDAGDTQ